MGIETLIVFLTCVFIFLIIVLSSWYRRKKLAEKDSFGVNRLHETVVNGQRTFRIATVSRQAGRVTVDVYEIRLPRISDSTCTPTITLLRPPTARPNHSLAGGQPPPPFSTAINMPSPSSNTEGISVVYEDNHEESLVPPPRYEEVIPISIISGNKVPEENSTTILPVGQTLTLS